MKRFMALFKLEYEGMFLPLWVIVLAMAVLQSALFGWRLSRAARNENLASLIEASGVPVVFAIAFASLLGLVGVRLAMNYAPSKSMYALLTLPVSRGHVYLAKLTAALLAGFVLLAAQMVLLVVFSLLVGAYDSGAHYAGITTRRHADLYLSLLDTGFLRMLFPPDLISLAFSLAGYLGSVCVSLYVAARLKTGNRRYTVILTVAWLAVILFSFPLIHNVRSINVVMFSLMVIIPVAASIRGIILFESGAVAG